MKTQNLILSSSMTECQFEFVYDIGGCKHTLVCPVEVPLLNTSIVELSHRLCLHHGIPEYHKDDLHKHLNTFVAEETETFYDAQSEAAFEKVRRNEIDIEEICRNWSYEDNGDTSDGSDKIPQDIDILSQYYHSLVHGPGLETLLDIESSYSSVVGDICDERDRDLTTLKDKHELEMEEIVKGVGKLYTEEEVNLLAARHFEDKQLVESQFASELSSLKSKQKHDYHDVIGRMYEESRTLESSEVDEMKNGISKFSSLLIATPNEDEGRMEESFTVNLGAQQKAMHNLRLTNISPLYLCKINQRRGESGINAIRIQTIMSLYSNMLAGLVLLVDNRVNSYTGIKQNFAKICEQSTDLHFDDLEQQLEVIRRDATRANCIRKASSYGSEVSDEKLEVGDVYVTRHSILESCHVVFHLVTGEDVTRSDITSRHPVIMGLRHIMKVSCQCDVTTISLPLLLTYEITEEMTVAWCVKRAELVFKCVKGFMIEMTSWGGNQTHTVQFIVPQAITDSLFNSFSNMLPQIFTISNPKLLRDKRRSTYTNSTSTANR